MNVTDSITPFEDWLKRWLAPSAFFVGVIVGFVVCCVTGRKAATTVAFQDFQRFHRFLSPEGLYYPTALQVRTLARRELPREKIAVIIGGSSVMQGAGQTAEGLWTENLQRELGDDFRVLNLAMVGGAPNEHGQLAAEMLSSTHPRLLYVTDCRINSFASYPDGIRDVYRYFFRDARGRGLLLPFPERDEALAALEPQRQASPAHEELTLQTRANRWLSFNDLWHIVGYEYCFTVWMNFTQHAPWQGRKHYVDPAVDKGPFQTRWARNKATLEELARPYREDDWQRYQQEVRHSVPVPLRSRTLAVVNRFNPAMIERLDAEAPGFRAQYDQKLQGALTHLRAGGLQAVEGCVTLDEADFMDRHHLLASGGAKLAVELVPVIRAQARRLGYLQGR